MAVCLGTRVTHFQVGAPAWFQVYRGSLLLSAGFIPCGGVTYAYEDDAPRWKVVLAALAGPLLPVIMSVPVFATSGLQPPTVIAGLIVILQTLVNLNPFMKGTDGQKAVMHLLAILNGRKALNC